MPFLQLDDIDLYYEVHGTGPAIVWVHGGQGSQLTWWQQVPFFMDRYTCVVYSQRGCGLSPEPEDGPGPQAFAADLAALVDHLGFDDVRLVGQSTGARTVLNYATLEPRRVRAMVMAGGMGGIDDPEILRIADTSIRPKEDRGELFVKADELILTDKLRRERPDLAYLYMANTRLSQRQAQSMEARNAFFNRIMDWSISTDLVVEKVDMPVLCLVGEDDRISPPAAVERFTKLLKNGEMTVIPDVNHSSYWEIPEVFNRLVDDFFARIG